mmetsp:Transcript_19312/g.36097  ORF Transcript_19312/g.36097 Transcript_19312/m.36097 type:complete len:83 (+) Transcript_19312:3133-3381(+)
MGLRDRDSKKKAEERCTLLVRDRIKEMRARKERDSPKGSPGEELRGGPQRKKGRRAEEGKERNASYIVVPAALIIFLQLYDI